jgi:hypothetical protein
MALYDVKLPDPYSEYDDDQLNALLPLYLMVVEQRGIWIKCLKCGRGIYTPVDHVLKRNKIPPNITAKQLDCRQVFRCSKCGSRVTKTYIQKDCPPFSLKK